MNKWLRFAFQALILIVCEALILYAAYNNKRLGLCSDSDGAVWPGRCVGLVGIMIFLVAPAFLVFYTVQIAPRLFIDKSKPVENKPAPQSIYEISYWLVGVVIPWYFLTVGLHLKLYWFFWLAVFLIFSYNFWKRYKKLELRTVAFGLVSILLIIGFVFWHASVR